MSTLIALLVSWLLFAASDHSDNALSIAVGATVALTVTRPMAVIGLRLIKSSKLFERERL